MSQNLHNLLHELKNDPNLGRADAEFVSALRTQVSALQHEEVQTSPGWVDVLLRVPRELTDMIARPVALAALFVVMVLGGWITGVNASLDTLPGDMLYPMKLVSEKAQLVLASSNSRSKLHAEFATRRLTEVATLVQSDVPQKEERLQRALDGFQKQMDGVSADLNGQADEQASVELARIIEQKSDELDIVLELTETVKDETSRDAVSDTVGTTQESKQQAVQTLVDKAPSSAVSRQELERQFVNDLRDLFARERTTELRIARIEGVLVKRTDVMVPFDARVIKARLKAVSASEAENFAAQGAYERAFELLNEQKTKLRALNDELLSVEIALTQPVIENGGIEELENLEKTIEDVDVGEEPMPSVQESDDAVVEKPAE